MKPVNDAPSFSMSSTPPVVKQNAGVQSAPAFATAINVGPSDESAQTVDFLVSTDRPAMFAVAPAIARDGTLTFTPAANASGATTITVRLHDSGGTADGGADTSAAQTFTLTTSPVNDAPSFTKGADQSAARDAGRQSVAGWATAITAGPEDESTQKVDFLVTADDPSLFQVAPAISADGTLTYTPLPTASGTTTVTVRLHDDGGTAEGGVDTSAAQTFRIAVTTFTEELGTYNGLLQAAAGAPMDAAHFGTVVITVAAKGVVTGQVRVGASNFVVRGKLDEAGVAHFGTALVPTLELKRRNLPSLVFALKVDVSDGTERLAGTLTESGAPFADFAAVRAGYSARSLIAEEKRGAYTIVFAPKESPEQTLVATQYPQGHGVGRLSVSKTGVAVLTGRLADGSTVSRSCALSKGGQWPYFTLLSAGKGSISGWVDFVARPGISDLEGLGLNWFKPKAASPRVKLYPAGWPGGIQADLLGSKYAVPSRTAKESVLPGLSAVDTDGNADVKFIGGGLPSPGMVHGAVNVTTANAVQPVAPTKTWVSARVVSTTGAVEGAFTGSTSPTRTLFHGVILQSQQKVVGYFLGAQECGSVEVVPMDHPGP